ncbi:STAS domain-containing protein [Nonomuraea pusilla]|uniref:STAS domain-containing protein n=1 Tax=Nonomuraea pusilla TaxID=46177 RepID=UPI00331741DC
MRSVLRGKLSGVGRNPLRIETVRYLHCTVVRATGELDHVGQARLSAHIDAVWHWSLGPVLVFDLTDLVFYDSSVIGVLGVVMRRMEEAGSGRIIVARPSAHLLTALRLTGLLPHVELRGSVEEAVAELALASDPAADLAMEQGLPPLQAARGDRR